MVSGSDLRKRFSIQYVDKDTSKKVRRACEPLLKWLDEAEDEE